MKWLKILIKIHSLFKSEFLCLSFFVRYALLYCSSNYDGTLVNIVVSPPGKLSDWWGMWEFLEEVSKVGWRVMTNSPDLRTASFLL